MKLVKAYNSVSLVLRIVIGMAIGTALALLIPNAAVTAPGIGILGKLFVGALKAIAPLLVFVLIISALAQSKEKMGKQFGTVIVLYLVSTFLAAAIAVVASYLFPVTITLTEAASDSAPESFAEIFTNLLTNIVSNPIGSIVSGNFLGILFWAIVLGFAFKGAADSTKRFLADASEAAQTAVDAALAAEDYPAAFAALAALRAPIDRFFDEVMVMDKDEQLRDNRLKLLNRFEAVFSGIANIGELARKK